MPNKPKPLPGETQLEFELKQLVYRIPHPRPLTDEVLSSFHDMTINNREDFLWGLDCVIGTLQAQWSYWERIRTAVNKEPTLRLVQIRNGGGDPNG